MSKPRKSIRRGILRNTGIKQSEEISSWVSSKIIWCNWILCSNPCSVFAPLSTVHNITILSCLCFVFYSSILHSITKVSVDWNIHLFWQDVTSGCLFLQNEVHHLRDFMREKWFQRRDLALGLTFVAKHSAAPSGAASEQEVDLQRRFCAEWRREKKGAC